MRYKEISKILGSYFLGFSAALTLPFFLCIYFQYFLDPKYHPQPHATKAFLVSILICLSLGAFLRYILGKNAQGIIFRKEGLIIVVSIWFLTPLIGALPFYLSNTIKSPIRAYFEATSGFTTTGATQMHPKKFDKKGNEIPDAIKVKGISEAHYAFYGTIDPVRDPKTGKILFEGIEAVSKGLLFWRSFIQWLGGVGIVVLFVAILPALGVGGKFLLHAEMPGPIKEGMTPRITETAWNLWKIYLTLSFLEVIALLITNADLSWFDAVTITFSTLSTGGFSIKNASIGAYQNIYTEWTVIIFMLLGSINFSLYYFAFRGKLFRLNDPELIVYIVVLLSSCIFATYKIVGLPQNLLTGSIIPGDQFSLGEAIRYGFFQLISAQTSTGFATANYDAWPYAIQSLMLLVMYLGGMSGSTAGGMKMIRHYMLFKINQHKVESLLRPDQVRVLRIGNSEVNKSVIITVLCFFLTVIAISALATFLYILNNIDPETAIATTTCMVNNIGIAFRAANPTNSFAFLSPSSCLLSCFLMIMGRLEFFAVLILLIPSFWKND